MQNARTRPHTTGSRAVTEALRDPATGSLPGGASREAPRPHGRPRVGRSGFSPVVVKQPPVGGWACDACPQVGTGGVSLLAHYNEAGHERFSPR